MRVKVGTFRVAKSSRTGIIYVPADVVNDSQFPLEEGDVLIEIGERGRKLVVTRVQTGEVP